MKQPILLLLNKWPCTQHLNITMKKKEHFIAIYPVSKVVTASLSAPSIMKSFEQYFLDHSIDMSKARFVCMEATNVNSEEKGRLKCLLKHAAPHLNWVG